MIAPRALLLLIASSFTTPLSAATSVVLPFGTGPETVTLSHTWGHRSVDVGLIVETTGSMSGELGNLKTGLIGAATTLQGSYPDLRIGVADFQDWPCSPHGSAALFDRPFRLRQRCTSNIPQVQTAINSLQTQVGSGGDAPESGFDALHFAVTGAAGGAGMCGGATIPAFDLGVSFVAGVADGPGGGMGFRDDGRATTVLVIVTDSAFNDSAGYAFSGPVGRPRALAELAGRGYRTGALLSDVTNTAAHDQLRELSQVSGTITPPAHGSSATLCETGLSGASKTPINGGCPNVFEFFSNGVGGGTAFASAVIGALDASPFVLGSALAGTPTPGGTSIDFVQSSAFTGASNPLFAPAPTLIGSSVTGAFASGTYDLQLVLQNLSVPDGGSAQVFPLYVKVLAGAEVVVLDTILVLVPQNIVGVTPQAGVLAFGVRSVTPNPFVRSCVAHVMLPEAGAVRVTVRDATGRKVRTLADGMRPAGRNEVVWDGARDDGTPAPAGVYLVQALWRGRVMGARIARVR